MQQQSTQKELSNLFQIAQKMAVLATADKKQIFSQYFKKIECLVKVKHKKNGA